MIKFFRYNIQKLNYNLVMKKISYCLTCLILISFVCNSTTIVYAENTYAQVVSRGTYVYKTPEINNNIKNIICVAENTYYVEILSQFNERFYKVNYNGTSGYMLIDEVKKVKGTPETPYPSNIKLTTYGKNCYLRSTPTKEDNTISIIPSNYNGLKFIGITYGEQLGDFDDNIWYLVEYLDVQGYIYNSYVSSINTIYPNTEQLSFLNNDFDVIANPLSNAQATTIIVCLSLPTLLIIYILYKKPKFKKSKTKKNIEVNEFEEML